MLKKIAFTALAFGICLFPQPVQALAEDISVEASISANRISLKDAARLTLTIHGGKVDGGPIELPKIDGLDSTYVGPSTRISIVNGRYSSDHSFIYNLFPTKTGHIQIPALTVSVSGKDYTTNPIDLEVESAPANNPAPASQEGALTEDNIKDRLFIHVSIPKAQVHVGERVPLRIKLLVNGLPVRNIQYPQLDKNGFSMEDFQPPRQYSQDVNGVKYDVVEFEAFIYPTRTGEISVGPVHIQGSLLYKNSQSQDNGIFNDSFFSSFFDTYQQRPLTITSQALNFRVLPLPEEGKPADFSGGVGQLDFHASISPDKVKVGDPVTLHMKVTGQGNFKSIQMPVFNDSRFKTYDPKIKDELNTKILEQVLIPISADIKEVPALSFGYFDANDNQYKTVVQGPFPLTVSAPAPGQEFKAVGFTDLSPVRVEQVDYVQKYIKKPLQDMLALFKTMQFWLALLGLGILLGLWSIWSHFQERLAKDTAFARRLGAFKNARQGMKQAQTHLQARQPAEFYNALIKTLNNYLADKLNQPSGGLAWETTYALLQQKKVPVQDLHTLQNVYRNSDLVRFAGGKSTPGQMSQDLAAVQSLISNLEEYLK